MPATLSSQHLFPGVEESEKVIESGEGSLWKARSCFVNRDHDMVRLRLRLYEINVEMGKTSDLDPAARWGFGKDFAMDNNVFQPALTEILIFYVICNLNNPVKSFAQVWFYLIIVAKRL